jgi:Fe-Mn family superoxide dismutase
MIEKRMSFERGIHAPYPLQEFSGLHGLRGLPDPLLQAHFKLYEGYVTNVNLLRRELKGVKSGTPEWSEINRRMGFELNGLRLHELYFANLTPDKPGTGRRLEDTLGEGWGSFARWMEEFKAMGQMRGVGWVILYEDPVHGGLSNHWITLHEDGHPAGFRPILVMDVWEHAFTGMDRHKYVEAFFENIDWKVVEGRLLDRS